MIAQANANPPFVFAQVARLTSDHLRLLSSVEALADRLSAGLSPRGRHRRAARHDRLGAENRMTRPAPEIKAWAVLGPGGKIAEFSAYLMAFATRQDAVDHALPDDGERVAPVTIRIGEGRALEVDG